jgi:2-polyprenyl-3-methyl-5-hydroxy-6-metoxy-1,4-benzoquinol methylase
VQRNGDMPQEAANNLTSREYWDNVHVAQPRLRLPSGLVVSTRNLQRLLKAQVAPGAKVLEIGFAPGKLLAYVAKTLGARVSGVDYSEKGIAFARRLFAVLGLQADFRCEDIFATTFQPGTFDMVYSVGVIEHFNDPRNIVRRHVELLRPGGTALILIPDYSGIYGRLQRSFDAQILELHNLRIMSPEAMLELAPADLVDHVESFRSGKPTSSLVTFERKWPPRLVGLLHALSNAIALVQPFDIPGLCPIIALRMTRSTEAV